MRPLRLHDARHTYASLALAAGKSVRWVASQLGHANPELTLRVYAHALREEETNLGFLDFSGTKRHPRGTDQKAGAGNENAPDSISRGRSVFMEHETRFELASASHLAMLRMDRYSYELFAYRSQFALTLARRSSA